MGNIKFKDVSQKSAVFHEAVFTKNDQGIIMSLKSVHMC